ncbi:spore coat protein CotJB [Clostridium septicum]|uniref:Spore coat protein CotJB n=1 Tax=Clostridium septicum TaxID=1504 RepID=A0A9N7JJE3_CLOSE|nr:spore coat protein CotJB [Clostridium septicum]AYE33006.1 spore coat protein CotJB [Clostridium septicum]MDU1313396.1 spore coat protein CotJB [Clostridium septicum]QAS61174.1 spore coat protein CotJB [Clostridium septicum]UEC22292.1 spore coat protein CotJB [Clostridium septicum]USR99569.1 spore coat protein CotJB [Clostridium septicum]
MSENSLLVNIMKYIFYAIDLNLYLDNFPTNQKAIDDYKSVSEKLDFLIVQYERCYGPLSNFGSASIEDPVKWTCNPWPWENK